MFLVATPFGALAFLLSWTIKDIPLRTTAGTPDPADTLAPTARPTVRTSDQEMERALTRLLGREQRREVYARLVTVAGVAASPRAAWLLLRVGQHPGMSRRDLAGLLHLTDAELERRLTELVATGYVRALRADLDQPVPLTEAGQHAFDALFQARQDSVARLAEDWEPDSIRAWSRCSTGSPTSLPPAARLPGRTWTTPGPRRSPGAPPNRAADGPAGLVLGGPAGFGGPAHNGCHGHRSAPAAGSRHLVRRSSQPVPDAR